MTTDERNFRSAYYEKVGCRSVEEKKSLEILLKEKPRNRLKLKQFCLRFAVPAVHRSILWNTLLGVYPTYTDSHEYVMIQRTEVYNDLLHALHVMRIIDEKSSRSKILYAMWLLETKNLYLGINLNNENNFVTITETLLDIFDNPVETYWIAKGFYEFTKEIEKESERLINLTNMLLKKEQSELYNHLENINVLSSLPLQNWFTCCFAGIIAEPAIVRIWDKIFGGSKKILVFVNIVLFTTLRRQLLRCKNIKSVLDVVESIKDDQGTADILVNKAIEFWQQDRVHSELVVHRKDN